MARIAIPNLEVIYRDVFVMQPLYRATRQWLMENDYIDDHGDASLESGMEILYHFRRGTSQNPAEKELRIWWRTVKAKNPEAAFGGVSNFYRYHMDIDWNVIQMVDMEIMREGKKEKVQFGELRITIRPFIEMPDLSQNLVMKFFDNWFRTRLLKKNLEENKKMIYQDAYRLQGMLKKYLEMKIFTPDMESFHEKFEFV